MAGFLRLPCSVLRTSRDLGIHHATGPNRLSADSADCAAALLAVRAHAITLVIWGRLRRSQSAGQTSAQGKARVRCGSRQRYVQT